MNYIWDSENKMTYNNRLGKYKFDTQFNYIKQNIVGKSILDLGGGSGRLAIPLFENGYEMTVLEENIEALNLLKSRNNKIATENQNINEFNLSDKFDSVICVEVLVYFSQLEIENIIKNVYNILENKGVFIFTYVNIKSWRFILRKIYKSLSKNSFDYQYIDIKNLNKIIINENFKIIDVTGYNWIPMKVHSNSIFVNFFRCFEKIFFLKYWKKQSPGLLYTIQKN